MFWRELTVIELIGLAASVVALAGIVLALLTAAGREAFARLGLRVADALVAWLEARLRPVAREARRRAPNPHPRPLSLEGEGRQDG